MQVIPMPRPSLVVLEFRASLKLWAVCNSAVNLNHSISSPAKLLHSSQLELAR
jgi:hypothetical protein